MLLLLRRLLMMMLMTLLGNLRLQTGTETLVLAILSSDKQHRKNVKHS